MSCSEHSAITFIQSFSTKFDVLFLESLGSTFLFQLDHRSLRSCCNGWSLGGLCYWRLGTFLTVGVSFPVFFILTLFTVSLLRFAFFAHCRTFLSNFGVFTFFASLLCQIFPSFLLSVRAGPGLLIPSLWFQGFLLGRLSLKEIYYLYLRRYS